MSWTRFIVALGATVGCSGEPDPTDTPVSDEEDTVVVEPEEPSYVSELLVIPDELRDAMVGVTWDHNCPVHLTDLRLLRFSHWNFEGVLVEGELVVAASASEVMDGAMKLAFEGRFPLESAKPASAFDGDDDASMAANNTSAFNCRKVTGGESYSQHSYGNAIDINPVQNPYVRGSTVLPEEGADYLIRDPNTPGLLTDGSPLTAHFLNAGWGWGGQWNSLKDYQHFSESGQ